MKILLMNNHALFREGLCHMLQKLRCGAVGILEADNFAEGFDLAGQHRDLAAALLELDMPDCKGAPSIKLFRQHYPQIPLVVISGAEDDGLINEAMNHGASGFVHKNSNEASLLNTLNLVLSGNITVHQTPLRQSYSGLWNKNSTGGRRSPDAKTCGLTARHMDILQYLAAGYSNKEIARTCNLSEGTVKVHVAAIYKILQVSNRIKASLAARQLGLDALAIR